MPIPESPRVVFSRNPIVSVHCELRFPAILKVSGESPVEFQELIREQFPYYETVPDGPTFPKGMPKEFETLLRVSGKERVAHVFVNENRNAEVNLREGALAFVSTEYSSWHDFKSVFEGPLQHFRRIYKPAFYERIGLRYVDAIFKEVLNIEEATWGELLRPELGGELGNADLAPMIYGRSGEVMLNLNVGKATIKHGIGFEPTEDGREYYLIDTDLFVDDKTKIDDANEILDKFNKDAGNIFRWCISDKLREALQ